MEKRVELLAPCGSYESFLVAVNAGADAVYLGGREFGARAYAENFSDEELVSVIRQAHLFEVKVYLTVNTLVKEQEFSKLYDYILPLYQAGLDGVIVQDMGVLGFLKRNFPDLKFHASTQMTITGAYGAAYLKEAGCERIVPARELSLQEIKAIKEKVSVEIEAFIHGAMCYCYSGQCLMSSMIGGRSGNRGRCAQPCRLPYKTAGKEEYFLSLKDMNTLEHIPELIEAGIDSFKIEGRMKKPEYVAGVVSIYKKYIDKYYRKNGRNVGTNENILNDIKNIRDKAKETKNERKDRRNITEDGRKDREKTGWEISSKDKQTLSSLYIRSETGNGYYFRSRGAEMLTLQKPGYNEADRELLSRLRETYVRELPRKVLDLYVRCRAGEPLYGEVRFTKEKEKEEVSFWVSGPAAQQADKRSVSEEEIRGQLVKTGGTPFVVKGCVVELGENTFVPMKWVKQLRRELLQKVYEAYGVREETEGQESLKDEEREKLGKALKEEIQEKLVEVLEERISEKCREPQGEEVSKNDRGPWKEEAPKECGRRIKENGSLTIMVQTKEQFEAVYSVLCQRAVQRKGTQKVEEQKGEAGKIEEQKADHVPEKDIKETLVIDADLLLEEKEIRDRLYAGAVNWGIKCPLILRKSDENFLKKLQTVIEEGRPQIIYCGTMDVLAWVKSISWRGKIAGEASLYAWNQEAVLFWEKELDRISIPFELDSREIRELCMAVQEAGEIGKREAVETACMETGSCFAGETVNLGSGRLEASIYGRAPFMVTANCIKLSSEQCDKNRKQYTGLTDRMGNKFPVYTNCSHCYNIIYNYLPTSYHENLWMLLEDGIRAFRVEFTTEDKAAAKEVLQTFYSLLASELEKKAWEERVAGKGRKKNSDKRMKQQKKNGFDERSPEIKKGKIAGMETTQGRFRRSVE